jgi:hypothetical protein
MKWIAHCRANCAALPLLGLAVCGGAPPADAGDRLAFTGAVTQIEGAAGGGLVPWALIGGLGTEDQVGATAFVTGVKTGDFSLRAGGFAVGVDDRLEVSAARQRFDAGSVVPGLTLGEDIVGLKVRLAGDAVFAPDSPLPQIAVGAQWKRTLDFNDVPRAVGAASGTGTDLYVAATKLYFAAVAGRNVILDVTVRRTQANQLGLLGFGGDAGGYRWEPELAGGIFLTDTLLLGAEYRDKHGDLRTFRETGAEDAFLAWGPLKSFTVTAAWTDLGPVAGKPPQRGAYLSLWFGM